MTTGGGVLAVALVFGEGCPGARPLPLRLERACLEPPEDLSALLARGRARLRELHLPHADPDLADRVSEAIGNRTDLRCMPVIDSVVGAQILLPAR